MVLAFCGSPWTRSSAGLVTASIVIAGLFASHNRLSLGNDIIADSAFTCAHSLELVAALAHLLHAGPGASAAGGGVMALCLPLQQVLSAYYFLEAFEFSKPLVGAGHPFELLCGGAVCQLGMYLCAGAVHLACLTEGVRVASTSTRVASREP